MKKESYFADVHVKSDERASVSIPLLAAAIVSGNEQKEPRDIEVADIQNLEVRFGLISQSGIGYPLGTVENPKEAYYEAQDGAITVHTFPMKSGNTGTATITGVYGDISFKATVRIVANGNETEHELGAFILLYAADGTGDYKTNIYMDGAGRVILERFEDGSTTIYDEHENPILKRNADGSTQFFDAYQSARLLIDANGAVSVHDDTAGTLAIAEAILARTRKHLLQYDGGANIKDEDGNVLTHAQIYDMLMNTPDFVVLVHADHAYHPNLVTPTQIAFTCSYASTNGDIVVERVNITNTNTVTKLTERAVTRNSVGGVAIGEDTAASGYCSHAEGGNTKATGDGTHAEGENTTANGYCSHAEGGSTKANGYCSHAEGEGCTAGGDYSHAEGLNCITDSNYSHADGVYNFVVPDEGAYMHGCGTHAKDHKNSVLFVDERVYILGVGDYDGTNHDSAKDLATVIAELQ